MKLQNQVCTREQSDALKELGIDQTCSLAIHYKNPIIGQAVIYRVGKLSGNKIAAFSVPELMVMLPTYEEVHTAGNNYWYCGRLDANETDFEYNGETMAQVIANRLIKLLKNKIVTPEECNERLLNS